VTIRAGVPTSKRVDVVWSMASFPVLETSSRQSAGWWPRHAFEIAIAD
jgi:hypothetical protein